MELLVRIKPGFFTMLLTSMFIFMLAYRTIAPYPYIYRQNLMGEYSLCPMAPISTIGTGVIGLIVFLITFVWRVDWNKKDKR